MFKLPFKIARGDVKPLPDIYYNRIFLSADDSKQV